MRSYRQAHRQGLSQEYALCSWSEGRVGGARGPQSMQPGEYVRSRRSKPPPLSCHIDAWRRVASGTLGWQGATGGKVIELF